MNFPVNIILHPNQQMIHECPARYKVIKAGKRFGKTKLAIFELIQAAGRKSNSIMWLVAPTYKHAKNIAWLEMKWLLPKQLIKRSVENDLMVELVNGSIIKLIGAENEDSLRGIRLDGVVFDEAAYTDSYAWEGIIRGQLLGNNQQGQGFAYFISSPNKTGRNWFSNFWETAKMKMNQNDKEWAAFYFTIHDNPTINPEEIEKLKDNTPDDTWELEYMARESSHAGQLVSEFSYANHVKEIETNDSWILVRGLDWGISHPTGCLWLYVNPVLRMVYVSDEFMRSNLVIQESAGAIKQMTGTRNVAWSVIDPSTAKRNSQTGRRDLDEFIRYGVGVVPGDNRDRGYDIMKMFFKKDMVRVHPKCKNLIYQLKNVQYGDKEGEDMLDCLRYALVRIHDFMFGGNMFPVEQEIKHTPGKYNFNDQLFGKVSKPNSFEWAYCESNEEYVA